MIKLLDNSPIPKSLTLWEFMEAFAIDTGSGKTHPVFNVFYLEQTLIIKSKLSKMTAQEFLDFTTHPATMIERHHGGNLHMRTNHRRMRFRKSMSPELIKRNNDHHWGMIFARLHESLFNTPYRGIKNEPT